jgi:hypothetical protein
MEWLCNNNAVIDLKKNCLTLNKRTFEIESGDRRLIEINEHNNTISTKY